jgi:hypothetical protein
LIFQNLKISLIVELDLVTKPYSFQVFWFFFRLSSIPRLLARQLLVSSVSSSLAVVFVSVSIFCTRQVALQQPPLSPFSIFLSASGYRNGCRFRVSKPFHFFLSLIFGSEHAINTLILSILFFIFDSEHAINIQSMPVTQDETALSRGHIPSHLRRQFQQIICMFLLNC